MNLDPADNPLREKIWRRDLTPAEQAELRAWLAKHPDAQADWADEANLNRLLDRLPNAPVPSNFTARVLDAVEREGRAKARFGARGPWWLRVLVPRTALAAVVVAGGIFFIRRSSEQSQRAEVANSLAAVAEVQSMPSPEALENFEVVRHLGQAPPPDEELLALMK